MKYVLGKGDVYQKALWQGAEEYGYKHIISSWPSKDVVLGYIFNLRKQIRPAITDVTLENKKSYAYESRITHYQQERVMSVHNDGNYLLLYFESSLKYLLRDNNERITVG